MLTTVWKGTIEYGVSAPVRMVVAAAEVKVEFSLINPETGKGVSQRFVDPESGKEVSKANLLRAAAVDGRTVTVSSEELSTIAPDKSHELTVDGFLKLDQVDPIYFSGSYYLLPDGDGDSAFQLLVQLLSARRPLALLGSLVRLGRRHHVLVRAAQGGLVLHTLWCAGEVRKADFPESVPAAPEDLRWARLVARAQAVDWEPGDLVDTYRRDLLALMASKAKPGALTAELKAAAKAGK